MRIRAPIVLVLLGAPSLARADRDEQAEQIIRSRCADCHVVGHGKEEGKLPHGFVDLTLAARRHDEAWLRAWLQDPHALKPSTRCYTSGLDGGQIDALVGLLHARAQPPHAHLVPPRKLAPPLPPSPPEPKPRRGLVRGQ